MSVFHNPYINGRTGVLDRAFLNEAVEVRGAKSWQSISIKDRPEMVPWELLNTTIRLSQIPGTENELQAKVGPNLPWAEEHFLERISGKPFNPPPSHERWPFNQNKNDEFREEEKFSHTYPERFWPKHANIEGTTNLGRRIFTPHVGIRFQYGDLADLVNLLRRDLYTRQAYLPVFFPEDTGAVYDQRVPCTIGYHFIYREGGLHCIYYIRSCDYLRHFNDDVYMAGRLTQTICNELNIGTGSLTMHITSFHIFAGDKPILRRKIERIENLSR